MTQIQKTICYANTVDWDFQGLTQRPHHLAKLLSQRGYKFYFVNITQRTDMVRQRITDNLEIYHNWEVFLRRVPKVDIYFSSYAARYIDLERIQADCVLYDSLDNFPANEHNEKDMISRSDIVLTASQPLYDLRSNQHNNVHLCKNACFVEYGENEYTIPDDLKQFKQTGKPIILFSGALASAWIDLVLLEKIARHYTIVFVGRFWDIKTLPKGMYYLGAKTHEQLQAYYRHCDVNILPFKRGQIADFSSPLKCFEAMIHGLPTVATDIPEAIAYDGVILPSSDHGEFISNIARAVKLKQSDEYKQLAIHTGRENTWDHRIDVIDNAIGEFFSKKMASV